LVLQNQAETTIKQTAPGLTVTGYWKMTYLCEVALRNYHICLFLLRGTDVARAEGTRSYLSSCKNFSFLHEAALD